MRKAHAILFIFFMGFFLIAAAFCFQQVQNNLSFYKFTHGDKDIWKDSNYYLWKANATNQELIIESEKAVSKNVIFLEIGVFSLLWFIFAFCFLFATKKEWQSYFTFAFSVKNTFSESI